MKPITFFLAIALIFSFVLRSKADPVDSLLNVATWEVASGGNGHTYALLKILTIWDSSVVIAPRIAHSGRPAHLATIASQEENDFILNNIIIEPTGQPQVLEQFYIGGIYENSQWGWITGEPFTFINWAINEPNNVGIENVLAFWGFNPGEAGFPSGQWNNTLNDLSINPDVSQWSIIEWEEPDTMKSLILPNPIFAAMQFPIDEFLAQIYIGDFPEFYTADDVDVSTLLINGSHTPGAAEIAQHAFFNSDALKLSVSMPDIVADYAPLWDVAEQVFTVEGAFTDATPFAVTGSFTSIGHRVGDINLDGSVNNRDLTYMVNRIFRDGPPPRFPELADVNGTCDDMNIHDLLFMINYIFRSGPAPVHCNQ